MAILFRWLMRAVLAVIALAAGAAALAYYLASQSLPDYDATWTVEGPSQEIEIVRDRYAVPHVLSKTDGDAFFGLGFVHAQDRLWQMTLLQAHGAGAAQRDLRAGDAQDRRADAGARPLRVCAAGGGVSDRRRPRGARGLCRRGERLAQAGADRRARARGAGVLPVLAGHLALDAGQFDRGAEAHGAADDRQGGDGDAARAAVAGAAAGAAARHPAGFAQRAADGAAAVLRALPRRRRRRRSSRRREARSTRCRGRGSPARRTPSRPWGGGRRAGRRCSPPTRTSR